LATLESGDSVDGGSSFLEEELSTDADGAAPLSPHLDASVDVAAVKGFFGESSARTTDGPDLERRILTQNQTPAAVVGV
jgi:hypothetical protein